MRALIFDCDGVLVDTEKDGHRVAFNETFKEKGFDFEWDIETYGELLKIAGGKERMKAYFEAKGYPAGISDSDSYIRELHKIKTDIFMEIINSGRLPLRSGVARLIDEAIQKGITLAVCSTSNEHAVNNIVSVLLGSERKKHIGIFAGDMVKNKKPDPEIYNLAKEKLGLNPANCMVVEDSRNGLLAAKTAGMKCIVTKSHYTESEDFSEAEAVFPELGDNPNIYITIKKLEQYF